MALNVTELVTDKITPRISLRDGGAVEISGLRVTHNLSPVSPQNGDIWITHEGLFYKSNDIVIGPLK